MEKAIIVAYNECRVIGNKNSLPWHLPADLRWFREKTAGHSVIMGYNTWLSIGRALPNRLNIVIDSRNPERKKEGIHFVPSLDKAVEVAYNASKDIYFIGGAKTYQQALKANLVDTIYATLVHGCHEGDTYFPVLPGWRSIKIEYFDEFDRLVMKPQDSLIEKRA